MRFSQDVLNAVLEQMLGKKKGSEREWNRHVKAHFGIPTDVIEELWIRLEEQITVSRIQFRPKHLLWTLHFMKVYNSWEVSSCTLRTCKRTLERWVWQGIGFLSELDLICWEARWEGDRGCACKITLDGTDFRTKEPHPFNSKWYSHKFHGAGLRYEVGVFIQTGHIVWFNGPVPCGYPDINIAREQINHMLAPGEMHVADGGYRDGNQWCEAPVSRNSNSHTVHNYMQETARSRHEIINGRLKQFGCLGQMYRHNIEKHQDVALAVANVTQLTFEMGYVPFDVEYAD